MAKLDLATALKASVAPTPVTATDEDTEPAGDEREPSAPAKLVALPHEDQPVGQAPTATPAEAEAATVTASPTPTPTRSRAPRKPKTPAARPAGEHELVVSGLAIELPVEIDRRLAAYIAKTKKSHHTVLLDAVEATYDRLPDLIRTALGEDDEATPKVTLFNRAPLVKPRPVHSGEKVRRTLKVTASNRALLDELTERFGAPSRTFLIVTAYDAYLPQLN